MEKKYVSNFMPVCGSCLLSAWKLTLSFLGIIAVPPVEFHLLPLWIWVSWWLVRPPEHKRDAESVPGSFFKWHSIFIAARSPTHQEVSGKSHAISTAFPENIALSLSLRFILFLFLCVSVSMNAQRPEKSIRFPGTGVLVVSRPVGSGTYAQVLCKHTKCS